MWKMALCTLTAVGGQPVGHLPPQPLFGSWKNHHRLSRAGSPVTVGILPLFRRTLRTWHIVIN
jgi:hypothetical protein